MGDQGKPGEAGGGKLQKRLEMMTQEYNKLQQQHFDLEKRFDVLISMTKGSADESEAGDSFPSRLLSVVSKLHNNEKYSDVHISFQDSSSSPAHWFVLQSRGFCLPENQGRDLDITRNTLPSNIDLSGLSTDVAKAFIHWMYTDDIALENKSEQFLLTLMSASAEYGVGASKILAQRYLIPKVQVHNAISHYQSAVTCHADLLKSHCAGIMFLHWEDFKPEDFKPLDTETLFVILKQQSKTPLHTAVRLRREDVVFKYLLEFMDQIPSVLNVPDTHGDVPLNIALASKQMSIASMLVSHGADVNTRFKAGVMTENRPPLLHHAITRHDHEACQFLLELEQTNANISDDAGDRALHLLAKLGPGMSDGMLGICETLIQSRAEVNAKNNEKDTALILSVKNKNLKMLRALLKSEAIHVDCMDSNNLPPLWWALKADEGNLDPNCDSQFCDSLVKLYEGRSANLNILVTPAKIPLLHHCLLNDMESAALYLINNNVDITQVDTEGATALHVASRRNLPAVVSGLLSAGADANCQTKYVYLEKPEPPPEPGSAKPKPVLPQQPKVKKMKKLTRMVKKKVTRPKQVLVSAAPAKAANPFEDEPSGPPNPFDESDDGNPFAEPDDGNPFGDDDDGGNPFGSPPEDGNPFADDAPAAAAGNPFGSEPSPAYKTVMVEEEIEELEDYEVTDDEDDDFGNSLVKRSESPEPQLRSLEASAQTAMHLAIWHGHENIVKIFLNYRQIFPNKLSLHTKNSFAQTPFALALWRGLECMNDLLAAGSDINVTNAENESLLQQAILHQDAASAIFLLDHYADFNFVTSQGDTALLLAVKRHLPTVVDALCIRGADMSKPDANGNVPLWVALVSGQEEVGQILVKHGCKTDGWHKTKKGYFQTLLHRAIQEQNEPVAVFLVRCSSKVDLDATFKHSDTSANMSIPEVEMCDSPLHMAARLGLSAVTGALLESGVKVNAKNTDKKTALHVAVESNKQPCIELLLSCLETSITAKDNKGMTPFAYTLKYRNEKAATIILERDPNAAEHLDSRGRSLLHVAVQTNDLQSVLFLIAKANVNSRMQDKSDMTPLHVAATTDKPSNETTQVIIRNLLLAGADVNAVTSQGQTALHLASDRGSHEICSILLENGANPNIGDSEGNTPLHLAVKNRHVYTIKKILALGKDTVDLSVKNKKGRTVFHTLASSSKSDSTSVMTIFPILINAKSSGKNEKASLNDVDAEGHSMLLLAYINGHAQLCRALVTRGVILGTPNKAGQSIFTHPAATNDLLHSLLKLISSEPQWCEHDACLECGNRFTITQRRHHCRHCGRSLCSNCSSSQTTIPKFHIDKNVRVCVTCFNVLKMGGAL